MKAEGFIRKRAMMIGSLFLFPEKDTYVDIRIIISIRAYTSVAFEFHILIISIASYTTNKACSWNIIWLFLRSQNGDDSDGRVIIK